MEITSDPSVNGFTLLVDTIGRWDDSPLDSVCQQEQKRIAANIKRALESQRQMVNFSS